MPDELIASGSTVRESGCVRCDNEQGLLLVPGTQRNADELAELAIAQVRPFLRRLLTSSHETPALQLVVPVVIEGRARDIILMVSRT